MILQFQIERKNKIENSSRTAWGGVLTYPSALERTSIELLGMRGVTIKTTSSGNKQD